MNQLLWREPTEGRTIAVVGDVYRFLVTGAETGGEYAMWQAIVMPGGGPPPHIHTREVESFFVIAGEITFMLGEERRIARAGTFISVPIGALHAFKNEGADRAEMLLWVAPAGLEQMFFETGVEVPEGTTTAGPPTHEEIEKLLEIAPRYGVEIRLGGE